MVSTGSAKLHQIFVKIRCLGFWCTLLGSIHMWWNAVWPFKKSRSCGTCSKGTSLISTTKLSTPYLWSKTARFLLIFKVISIFNLQIALWCFISTTKLSTPYLWSKTECYLVSKYLFVCNINFEALNCPLTVIIWNPSIWKRKIQKVMRFQKQIFLYSFPPKTHDFFLDFCP